MRAPREILPLTLALLDGQLGVLFICPDCRVQSAASLEPDTSHAPDPSYARYVLRCPKSYCTFQRLVEVRRGLLALA